MVANKRGKLQREVKAIDIDIAFMKNIMIDQKVS